MGSGLMGVEDWPIMSTVYAFYFFIALGSTAPTISFPINSQVPPVARVSIPFTFTFSASTFSGSSTLDYTLSNAPSWLSLDGATRTLSGFVPESDANTAPVIQITASDNTGSVTMNTTLVVSANPAPSIAIPLGDQLAVFGTYSRPSSLLYYPSMPFNITFDPGTFSSGALNHYAVTSDNTPLPSWISFDGASLSYSGKTPDYYSLVQPPQTWGIQLIASDVLGFSGVAIEFNIVVGTHKLNFTDGFLSATATVGKFLNFTSLFGSLYLDGNAAKTSDIVSADAKTPDWLYFSNSTFSLSGTPPIGTTSFNVSVLAVDIYGDTASAVVHISLGASVFSGTVGSVNATIGTPFSYNLSPLFFNASDVAISLQIDPLTWWLSFNNQNLDLSGNVPLDDQRSKIYVAINATSKSSNASEFQILTISVEYAADVVSSSLSTTSATATAKSTSIGLATNAATTGTFTPNKLSRGEIVAITVPVVLFSVIVISLFCFCYIRRRQLSRGNDVSPHKTEISKPIPVLNQIRGNSEAQNRMASSDAFKITSFSSKRHTAALKRHSQAMSNLTGGASMSHRDSHSSSTRGRSYSENALSDFRNTWMYAQDSAYPPLRTSAINRSLARNTRNFSRKNSTQLSSGYGSSADVLGSTASQRTSKTSRASIQQTPDFAYDIGSIKQGLSRRHTPDHVGTSGIGRALSGIGHGSRRTATNYTNLKENQDSYGIGHGTRGFTIGSQNPTLLQEGNSWVLIGSAEMREQHRHSAMSALTESTEVLNSPKKITLRHVPKSPNEPAIARLSASSKSSQPSSKRAVGSSPFFGGSSRLISRGISHKSLWSVRDRRLYPSSLQDRGRGEPVDGLERSITAGLRDTEPSSLNPTPNLARDSLGITYGGPREGNRQLREYINEVGRYENLSLRSSIHFSDNDSRFQSAEHSPGSQHFEEARDQEGDLAHDRDFYRSSPRDDASRSSFNRDRYGLDESPELSLAIGARTVVRPNLPIAFSSSSATERQNFLAEPIQEGDIANAGRPPSTYERRHVREKSSSTSYLGAASEDYADINFDGAHGAFL